MNVATVSYRDPEAAPKFVHSLVETGFGVLSDHPIPHALVRDVFGEWAEFFASDSKHDFRFDPAKQSGYFPFRSENAKASPIKDLKEFFHIYSWTDLPPQLTQKTWDLFHQFERLGAELLSWIEQESPAAVRQLYSMPLPQMIEASRETLFRPIHYPPIEGGIEPGAIRAAAHEDINLITLLPAATAPGLEVMDTSGQWHEVSCDPGTIAINSGDMLQMASGGYFRSTTHRVINPEGTDRFAPRYSMPIFLHPRAEVRLSAEHTAKTYLEERLREIGLLKDHETKKA